MSPARRCSRTACDRSAVTTLTYVYADQTAVLGPLATYAEPHAYDLCEVHAERLSAPRGGEVLRLVSDLSPRGPSDDDLLAPVVGQHGGVLDGVLDQPELLVPAAVDLGDDVEHESVEALAPCGPLGDAGISRHDAGATLTAAPPVAGHPPAFVRPRVHPLVHAASLRLSARLDG